MKTIAGMRESLSDYFNDKEIKINVCVQKNRTLKREDTVGKIVLSLDMAVAIFGSYEMMWNKMDTYNNSTEYSDYALPCIRCGVYVPLEDNGESKKDSE